MSREHSNYQPNTDKEYWEAINNHLHEYDKLSTGKEYHTLWKGNRVVAKINMSNLN